MHTLSVTTCLVALAAALLPTSAPRAALSAARLHDGNDIQLAGASRPMLQALWKDSRAAMQERVACIAGYRDGAVAYITSLEPIAEAADSMNASAITSIHRCGPPTWMGTVHTHIAHLNGIPYVTFSGADRGVMREWHRLWNADGVFCVLYDDEHAYCEVGDASGRTLDYAAARADAPPH